MSLVAYAGFERVQEPDRACNQRLFEPGADNQSAVCLRCGKPIHQHAVKDARAKIIDALRKAGGPLCAGQLAELVYGEDSRANRRRVIGHIWRMNRAGVSIVALKGYALNDA